jgi:hypothetical protein
MDDVVLEDQIFDDDSLMLPNFLSWVQRRVEDLNLVFLLLIDLNIKD